MDCEKTFTPIVSLRRGPGIKFLRGLGVGVSAYNFYWAWARHKISSWPSLRSWRDFACECFCFGSVSRRFPAHESRQLRRLFIAWSEMFPPIISLRRGPGIKFTLWPRDRRSRLLTLKAWVRHKIFSWTARRHSHL